MRATNLVFTNATILPAKRSFLIGIPIESTSSPTVKSTLFVKLKTAAKDFLIIQN